MTRVVLLAIGSRGDTLPHLALAGALRRARYEAIVLLQPEYAGLADGAGVPHASLGSGFAHYAAHDPRAVRGLRGGPAATHRALTRWLAQAAEPMARTVAGQVRSGDVLITGLAGLAMGVALHEAHGVPVVHAAFQAVPRTAHGEATFLALVPGRTTRLNRTWAERVTWRLLVRLGASPAGELRRRLDLPAGPPAEVARRAGTFPTLIATSPLLAPPVPDWPDRTRVTGAWTLPETTDWRPPAALAEFLGAGDPPVYVGFGSSVAADAAADLRLVEEAATRARVRVVTQPDEYSATGAPTSDHVHVLSSGTPYPWLFERMTAVVHHGGAGTTIAGLRAGVPSAVVPHGMDQPFHGRRVQALGVGPAPLPRRRVTATRLADLLVHLTRAPEAETFRRRAAAVSREVRAEDGTATAIRQLTEWGVLPPRERRPGARA